MLKESVEYLKSNSGGDKSGEATSSSLSMQRLDNYFDFDLANKNEYVFDRGGLDIDDENTHASKTEPPFNPDRIVYT